MGLNPGPLRPLWRHQSSININTEKWSFLFVFLGFFWVFLNPAKSDFCESCWRSDSTGSVCVGRLEETDSCFRRSSGVVPVGLPAAPMCALDSSKAEELLTLMWLPSSGNRAERQRRDGEQTFVFTLPSFGRLPRLPRRRDRVARTCAFPPPN